MLWRSVLTLQALEALRKLVLALVRRTRMRQLCTGALPLGQVSLVIIDD
jgi:hypothetical protein